MAYINSGLGNLNFGYDSTTKGPIGKDPYSAGRDPYGAGYVAPPVGSIGSAAVPPIPIPRLDFGGGLMTPSGSGTATSSSFSGSNMAPVNLPPPEAADLSRLTSLADKVQRKKMIKKAMADYDELSAATQASGFQAAGNAGTTYANRLMQQGINPIASGVVAAQARLPVYRSLAEISTEKDKTRIDAVSRADSLAANISNSIAGLQQSHAQTLADFNLKQAGYNVDLSKFSKSNSLAQEELAARTALGYASLNQSGSGSGRGSNSQYTPSWKELSTIRSAQNMEAPQALANWQRVGAAASAGKFENNPVF